MASNEPETRTLENKVLRLSEIFPLIQRSSIRHSDQITIELRTNPEFWIGSDPEFWENPFYTADSVVYTIEKEGRRNEAILYIGREPTNPIFNNIEKATLDLLSRENYILPIEEVEDVKNAVTTLRVKLSDLELRGKSDEFRFYEIDTAEYDKSNEHQREVAERFYGQQDDFVRIMKNLSGRKIKKIRIGVLSPEYVKRMTPKDKALVRASRLYHYHAASGFFATDNRVNEYCTIRGIVLDPIEQAYVTLLKDPNLAVQRMNPEIAAKLSNIISMYSKH